MIMKRIYILFAFIAVLFAAGEIGARPRFASKRNMEVSAGYSRAATSYMSGVAESSNILDGFYLDLTYGWNFLEGKAGILALEPGLRFSYMEDVKAEDNRAILTKDALKESYIDIPVLVKYSYKFYYFTVSAFAGPDFSVGLSSTSWTCRDKYMFKYRNYTGIEEFKGVRPTESVNINMLPDYSRFDIKCRFGLSLVFMDRFSLKAACNIGLLNRSKAVKTNMLNPLIKTNVFDVGLGFRF